MRLPKISIVTSELQALPDLPVLLDSLVDQAALDPQALQELPVLRDSEVPQVRSDKSFLLSGINSQKVTKTESTPKVRSPEFPNTLMFLFHKQLELFLLIQLCVNSCA